MYKKAFFFPFFIVPPKKFKRALLKHMVRTEMEAAETKKIF